MRHGQVWMGNRGGQGCPCFSVRFGDGRQAGLPVVAYQRSETPDVDGITGTPEPLDPVSSGNEPNTSPPVQNSIEVLGRVGNGAHQERLRNPDARDAEHHPRNGGKARKTRVRRPVGIEAHHLGVCSQSSDSSDYEWAFTHVEEAAFVRKAAGSRVGACLYQSPAVEERSHGDNPVIVVGRIDTAYLPYVS